MCSGEGCQHCNDGDFAVDGCPNAYCREIAPAIRLIDLYNKGLPPVGGGTLDQSAWFIDAARTLEYEEQLIKAESSE